MRIQALKFRLPNREVDSSQMLREVTKINPPILLTFWILLFVAAKRRLEYEPKLGVISGEIFCNVPY